MATHAVDKIMHKRTKELVHIISKMEGSKGDIYIKLAGVCFSQPTTVRIWASGSRVIPENKLYLIKRGVSQ